VNIRDYRPGEDQAAVRTCLIELQEYERALDPRLPPGPEIADGYLDRLFRRCASLEGRIFVAEVESGVVGYVCALIDCRSDAPDDDSTLFAYIEDLVVLPAYRGQGCGQALLRRAEACAAARGRSTLRLRVKGGNRAARGLYARAGYLEYEVELEKRLPR
jgi:ribosomal protein S18 acetylase RimI-like enzyme